MFFWMTVARAAGGPSVAIHWGPSGAQVEVAAPPGQKIAPDAPGTLTFSAGEAEWSASALGAPTLVAPIDARGLAVHGEVALGVCNLDGTECQPGRWWFAGPIPDQRKGTVSFTAGAAAEAVFGPQATAEAADAAFARAQRNGRAVLLDFSAVWCPPCNLLAAEVLHGEPVPELDQYEIAVVDVDHPSSFALKDRYDVGGYPTIVVTDAEGHERARHLGYTTREEFVAWLASAAHSTEAAELAGDPSAVPPGRAAELGLALMFSGDEEQAGIWLARAEADPAANPEALHLLRFQVKPTAEELDWLLANAPGRAADFAPAAVELGGPRAQQAVALELRAARGPALSVALDHAAQLAPEAERAGWYEAAAASLRNELTGDPQRDKGYVTDLAWLMAEAGDVDGAVALLSSWSAASPGDPTFDLSLARRLIEAERYPEALAAADRALAAAWGDNHLRCAAAKAEALVALGRADEAKAVAIEELAAQPAPTAEVRTHRYRAALEAIATGREP